MSFDGFGEGGFTDEIRGIISDFSIPPEVPGIQEFLALIIELEKEDNHKFTILFLISGFGFGFEAGGADPNIIPWYGPFMAYMHMRGHQNFDRMNAIRALQRATKEALKNAMRKPN